MQHPFATALALLAAGLASAGCSDSDRKPFLPPPASKAGTTTDSGSKGSSPSGGSSGSDAGSGGSAPSLVTVPGEFATVSAALAAVAGGGTVRVSAGTYSLASGEAFPLRVPPGIRLESVSGAAATVLDASGVSDSVIRLVSAQGAVVDGFTITGGSAASGGGGVYVQDAGVSITNNIVRDNKAGGAGSGVFVTGADDTLLRNNLILRNTTLSGDPHNVQVTDSAQVRVHNNTIALADSNGLFPQNATGIDIRNNIFFRNGTVGVRGRGICFFSNPTPTIHYNRFFDNAISALVFLGSVGNVSAAVGNAVDPGDGVAFNQDGDPQFAGVASDDFALATGSPAVDAGDPAAAHNDQDGSRNDQGHTGGPHTRF